MRNSSTEVFHFGEKEQLKKKTFKTIINTLDNALETNLALCVCEETLATP
jgi:predicted peroxiredoxin